ncbi:hypothetical protein mRhiFer1_008918 [Rhinolophus ferrumequinum]|uniref:Uncharacterized protein n=1 Tax=Rhinolophus ferrumequinum TaxID=59479 RepID=A0A7J7TDK9_RHIFE|nr:hypothetical protein mRhiFer1_008918 [Rhinolophus ferrumequinum]
MMSQDRHKWMHTPSQTLRHATPRLSHHTGCAGHSDLQTPPHTDPRLCVPRVWLSVCLTHTGTHMHQGSQRAQVPCFQPQPWTYWPEPLTLGYWLGGPSCSGLGGGFCTVAVGHAAPTAFLTSHKCVWCDNRAP